MQIFRHYEGLPAEAQGGVVAIGNFDGVHRGHRAIIEEAGLIARSSLSPWTVLTFEPHPRSLFRPDSGPFRLTPFAIKARLIEEMGVDHMVVLTFDREFSERSAGSFVSDILIGGLKARHVVSGYDFAFGHNREGTCDLLLTMGKERGFDFTAVSAVLDEEGNAYSSTRVRDCLRRGDPRGAAKVLGRSFEIEGEVFRGDRRGHAIGYPTANLGLGDFLRPARGVYAVRAGIVEGGDLVWRNGVANLGVRPTFAGEDLMLEVYIFDFDGDLYGRNLRVALVDFLRPEKKFDGLEALKAQIADDSARARRVLAEA